MSLPAWRHGKQGGAGNALPDGITTTGRRGKVPGGKTGTLRDKVA
jgi:hypothetical protein